MAAGLPHLLSVDKIKHKNEKTIKDNTFSNSFVELGGGVDDVPGWCCDGVCVELGFR